LFTGECYNGYRCLKNIFNQAKALLCNIKLHNFLQTWPFSR